MGKKRKKDGLAKRLKNSTKERKDKFVFRDPPYSKLENSRKKKKRNGRRGEGRRKEGKKGGRQDHNAKSAQSQLFSSFPSENYQRTINNQKNKMRG